MREIKFRAWNEGIHRMFSADELGADELTINPDGRGFVNVNSTSTKLSQYYPHMIPLQYTGLKDKNGTDIFEGDILKIELDNQTYESPVMSEHGCWVIYHPYRIVYETGEFDLINIGWWTSHDNVEIVGNIYEGKV